MKKQLRTFYIMHSIDWFAYTLLGILLPVYFISLGYPIFQVIAYFIVCCFGIAFFFFVAGFFATRFGVKECLFLRLPLRFLQLVMLYFLPQAGFLFFPLAVIHAMQISFYWFPYHVIFTQSASEDRMGRDVGKLSAYTQALSVVAPLTGAFIAFKFGYNYLFLLSGAVHLIAAIPLFYLKNWQSKIRFQPEIIWRLFKKHRKFFFATMNYYLVAEAEGVILPIFVYLTFKNIISVGTIGAMAGGGAVLFTLLIGNFSDKYNKKKLLKLGAALMIIIWVLRYFAVDEKVYYLLSILAGFFMILMAIPINAINYSIAKGENVDEFVVTREIMINVGRIIIYSLALVMSAKINYSFLAAAGALIYFIIIKQSYGKKN